MKRIYIYRFIILVTLVISLVRCTEETDYPLYKDNYSTLYSFLEDNPDYSSFKAIVDAATIGESGQSMSSVYSSYNSNEGGNRYTLFLPTNMAITSFLEAQNMTLDGLLASTQDCWDLSTHHLINVRVYSSDFPNGEMPDTSINGASHVVRFMSSSSKVSYLIDEIASVVYTDLNQSNGVIHVIDNVLTPLSLTSCEWLEDDGEYDIFVAALKLTGLYNEFQSIDTKLYPFTMFVESDSIYANAGIMSIDDLIAKVSPSETNYTDENNALNLFVAYHVLDSKALYITEMSDGSTNYDTFTSYPLSISLTSGLSTSAGLSEGIGINVGHIDYDTIPSGAGDTTFIDYVSIYESQSNTPTLSGVIHSINYILEVDTNITPATKTFYFREDPVINEYYFEEENRYYIFEDADLERFTFGGDLTQIRYYKSDDENESATHNDYLTIFGNYEISFRTTKIVVGDYYLKLKINVSEKEGSSGLIDVYLDGKKVGATINISSLEPTNVNTLYTVLNAGKVSVEGYNEHVVTVKAVTPGALVWDIIQFVP